MLHVLVTATHRESRLALDSSDDCRGGIHYFAFGGERAIWAPLPALKAAQQWVLRNIVEKLPVQEPPDSGE